LLNTGTNPVIPYVNTFCRLDALAMGALIATKFRSLKSLTVIRDYSLIVLCISVISILTLVVSIHSMDNLHPLIVTLGYSLNVLLFGSILILTATGHTPLKKLMENPIMVFFGKYSYSLYIFHVPIYYILSHTILSNGTMWLSLLLSLLAFIISVIIAIFTMKTIEMPFLKLKRYFN